MAGRIVVVVGAGVAGATAAYALRAADPRLDVVVLESTDRVGGKLSRVELAGTTVDVGAESMLARRPEALDLAREVGLGDRLTTPGTTSAGIWTRAAVRPMPPTVMGIPADLAALAASGILSRSALLRLRAVSRVPRRRAAVVDGDVSVGDFVAKQLGTEVRDRLVEPLLGGVYAGHARYLSLRAAAPQIAALLDQGAPLLEAARRTRAAADAEPDRGPVFAGLVGGVGQLVPAVLDASGATLSTRTTARELQRLPDGRWRVVVGPTNAVELIDADAVVLATPGPATARLLSEPVPLAAREIRRIDYASMAVISLAVASSAVPAGGLVGSGFLVPPVDGRRIKAATYSSGKWPWLAESVGDGVHLVRTSIGRAGEEALLQRDDADLVAMAVADLQDAIGLRGPLLDAHVQRWGGSLPQYNVGHLDRVRRAEEALASVPGLAVCGAAYHGVGIPAVIASARSAARTILADLTRG